MVPRQKVYVRNFTESQNREFKDMRDPERIKRITALLLEAWSLAPDFRLAQIVMVIADQTHDHAALWHLDDDLMEAKIRSFIERGGKSN